MDLCSIEYLYNIRVKYDAIINNIENGVYTNKAKYPIKPCKPIVSENSKHQDAVMKEYKELLYNYKEEVKRYQEEDIKCHRKLKSDIIDMLIASGANEEKAENAYTIASNHAECNQEVLDYAYELCSLFGRSLF